MLFLLERYAFFVRKLIFCCMWANRGVDVGEREGWSNLGSLPCLMWESERGGQIAGVSTAWCKRAGVVVKSWESPLPDVREQEWWSNRGSLPCLMWESGSGGQIAGVSPAWCGRAGGVVKSRESPLAWCERDDRCVSCMYQHPRTHTGMTSLYWLPREVSTAWMWESYLPRMAKFARWADSIRLWGVSSINHQSAIIMLMHGNEWAIHFLFTLVPAVIDTFI